jgi:CHAT domain-containing protein/Flp pilus assembly protein TadD
MMNNSKIEAANYTHMGLDFGQAGQYEMAMDCFKRALALDSSNAQTHFGIGTVFSCIGNPDMAIEAFEKAIALKPDYYLFYSSLGLAYYRKEEIEKALENFNQAIKLNPKDDYTYVSLGNAYSYLGDDNRAIEYYLKAIDLNNSYSSAYNSLGCLYILKGEFEQAEEYCKKAVSMEKANFDYQYNLAIVYASLKENGKTPKLNDALKLYNNMIDKIPTNDSFYHGRAQAYRGKGDYVNALADSNKAIQYGPYDFKNYRERGMIYKMLAQKENNNDYYRLAIQDFSSAIDKSKRVARDYYERGDAYEKINDHPQALKDYKTSLDNAKESNTISNLIDRTWFYAARIYQEFPYLDSKLKTDPFCDKLFELTRDGLSQSITKSEELRGSMGSRGKQLMYQNLFLYYGAVDFEVLAGNGDKAFEYSEALRSRGFLEQLGTKAALSLPGISEDERKEVLRLDDVIKSCKKVVDDFFSSDQNTIQRNDETHEVIDKKKQIINAGERLSQAEKELKALNEKIALHVPRYKELNDPQLIDITAAKTFCGDEKIVLEYVLWDETIPYKLDASINISPVRPMINSYCLVLSKNRVTPVPLDNSYINDKLRMRSDIKELRKLINNKRNESFFENYRNNLYNELIKPVLDRNLIPEGIKDVVVVPDSTLAFLPFDILRENTGSQEFGYTYNVSISPSISVSLLNRQAEQRDEKILAFGGALYNDKGIDSERRNANFVVRPDTAENIPEKKKTFNLFSLTKSGRDRAGSEIANLPGTKTEVENLKKIASKCKKTIEVFTGKDASESKVKEMSINGSLEKYTIIHFAGHGCYDKSNPDKWGLVFSEVAYPPETTKEDGYLSIEDIVQLRLNASMVELSVCDAGRGIPQRGDGMVGLPRSFMAAGARNVGVSLWALDDDATCVFMIALYKKVFEQQMSFRRAYYEVKNEFRNGTVKIDSSDEKLKFNDIWKHPRYWAGFMLYE